MVPVYPWHWPGDLQGAWIPLTLVRITCMVPVYPWHWLGYLHGTCITLKLVRIPAEHLYTPDTGQGTCKVPGYLWRRSDYQRKRLFQWPRITCVIEGLLDRMHGFGACVMRATPSTIELSRSILILSLRNTRWRGFQVFTGGFLAPGSCPNHSLQFVRW